MEEENESLRKSLRSIIASVKSDKKSSSRSKQAVPEHRNLQGILSPQKNWTSTIPASPHGTRDARALHTTNPQKSKTGCLNDSFQSRDLLRGDSSSKLNDTRSRLL